MEEIWQIEMFWVEGKQGRLRSGAGGMVINQTHITTSNISCKSPVFELYLEAERSFSHISYAFDLFWFKQTVGAFLLFLTRLLETP